MNLCFFVAKIPTLLRCQLWRSALSQKQLCYCRWHLLFTLSFIIYITISQNIIKQWNFFSLAALSCYRKISGCAKEREREKKVVPIRTCMSQFKWECGTFRNSQWPLRRLLIISMCFVVAHYHICWWSLALDIFSFHWRCIWRRLCALHVIWQENVWTLLRIRWVQSSCAGKFPALFQNSCAHTFDMNDSFFPLPMTTNSNCIRFI